MFRLLLSLILFSFSLILLPVSVQAAEPTFLQKWLPALFPPDTGPGPEDTLQAPFGDSGAPAKTIEGLEWRGGGQGDSSEPGGFLGVPHLANEEVSEWAVTHVSTVLTFGEGEDYNTKLVQMKPYFGEAGFQQYREFMQSNNLVKVLESQKFYLSSFVEQIPLLLNEGEVEGRYRWLYEIPVMISYMDRGMENYRRGEPVTQALVLRIQVGRTGEGADKSGLQIESWDGKLKKLEKQ